MVSSALISERLSGISIPLSSSSGNTFSAGTKKDLLGRGGRRRGDALRLLSMLFLCDTRDDLLSVSRNISLVSLVHSFRIDCVSSLIFLEEGVVGRAYAVVVWCSKFRLFMEDRIDSSTTLTIMLFWFFIISSYNLILSFSALLWFFSISISFPCLRIFFSAFLFSVKFEVLCTCTMLLPTAFTNISSEPIPLSLRPAG